MSSLSCTRPPSQNRRPLMFLGFLTLSSLRADLQSSTGEGSQENLRMTVTDTAASPAPPSSLEVGAVCSSLLNSSKTHRMSPFSPFQEKIRPYVAWLSDGQADKRRYLLEQLNSASLIRDDCYR